MPDVAMTDRRDSYTILTDRLIDSRLLCLASPPRLKTNDSLHKQLAIGFLTN